MFETTKKKKIKKDDVVKGRGYVWGFVYLDLLYPDKTPRTEKLVTRDYYPQWLGMMKSWMYYSLERVVYYGLLAIANRNTTLGLTIQTLLLQLHMYGIGHVNESPIISAWHGRSPSFFFFYGVILVISKTQKPLVFYNNFGGITDKKVELADNIVQIKKNNETKSIAHMLPDPNIRSHC